MSLPDPSIEPEVPNGQSSNGSFPRLLGKRSDEKTEPATSSMTRASKYVRSGHKRRVYIIGICGPSCGGKSTLARALGELLHSPADPIPLDAYFMEDRLPVDENLGTNWETPQGVNFEKLRNDIESVAENLATASRMPRELLVVRDPRHGKGDILHDSWKDHDLSTNDEIFLLAEGFLLFHDPELCHLFDAMIWVETDKDSCCKRRHHRDGQHLSVEEFNTWYYGLVWSHFEMYRDIQLTNACTALRLDGGRRPEDLAKEALTFIGKELGHLDDGFPDEQDADPKKNPFLMVRNISAA